MGLAQRASVGAGAGACLTQTRICISPQKQAPKRAGLPCQVCVLSCLLPSVQTTC